MKTKMLETEDAGFYAAAAARDARMKSIAAESTYSQVQKNAATRMQDALETVYECEKVYVTYRAKFISVKVPKPYSVQDKKNLKLLEDSWEKQGYIKLTSNQGIIYRIPKV